MSETTIYNITRKFTNTEIDMADVESANVAFQSEFTGIQATPKYSVAKNGTDVVATLPGVTYYATVDINEDFIADGHLEQVANGVWNSSNPKNYSLGYGKQSIIDALESGTWKNGDDTVDIAGYKALEDKTGWVFQGGTLKLTIETHKSHHASYDSYYFTTKTLYNLEAALTETDTPGIEHHEFTDVHMLLDVADLTAVNNGTYTGANWYGAAWEAAQTNYGSNLALSNLHIWEVIGETETDITTQYLAEAAAHTGFDTESDYNDALAGAANDQTLTFANFVDNNNLSVNDSKYLVDLTKEGATSYAGTIMNEKVTANGEKETFNMGRGQDKITFKGKFGDDVVKLSGKDNDELVLEFADDAAVTAKPVGNDLVITDNTLEYYATVKVDCDYVFEAGNESEQNPEGKTSIVDYLQSGTWKNGSKTVNLEQYKALTEAQKAEYTFQGGTLRFSIMDWAGDGSAYYFGTRLNDTAVEGNPLRFGADKNDLAHMYAGTFSGENGFYQNCYAAFQWRCSQTEWAKDINMSDLHIYKLENGTATDITEDYLAEASTYDIETMYAEQDFNGGTVTIKDFGKTSTLEHVLIDGLDLAEETYFVEMGKDKKGKPLTSYTGTRLNEAIESQAANETFQMGTATKDEYGNGEDLIYFTGKYGDDTVKVADDATLNLVFDDPLGLTYSAKGNDLKITDNTLEYYATVKVDCDYVFEAGNESEQNPEGKTSIVDYLQSGTWKKGNKTVNLEQYKALTEAQRAEYTFQGGTLRFSIMDWAGDGSAYYFGTRLNDTAVEGNPLRFGADKNDLAHMYAGTFNGENGFYQNCYAAFQWRCSQTEWAKDINMSDLHIYKLENGTATDITEAYLAETSTYDIETMYNEQDFSGGTVTIKDFSNAARTADDIRINGTAEALYRRNYNGTIVYTDPQVAKLFTTTDADVKGGKITIKGNTNNTVDVSNYSSDSAKGVKITTGKGNDYITGSMYNDTITSKGGYNNVVEMGGTNKITLGNGGSTVTVTGYSSNTIKAKGGDNYLDIDSLGANKVTLGKGDDTVWLQDGVNTVNVGAGENRIWAVDGNNKVTGGKNKDVLTVNAGQTTAKLGAGNDIADINGGNVVLDMGAGNDNVYFDNYGIVGVGDIIASVNGGKGNDLYDLSQVTFTKHDEDAGTFANRIAITDKKGTNTIVLDDNDTPGFADDYDVYFNVSIKTKKGKITKTTVGKSIIINKDDDIANKDTGVVYNYDGKLTKQGVTKNLLVTADAETAGKGLNISQIASTVATWLNANGYQSADAVMYGSDDTARAQLAGIYQGADTVYMKDGVTAFAGYTAANVFQDPVNM